MKAEWPIFTVEELIERKILAPPLDGNHGSIHPKSCDFVSAGVPFIMASDLINSRIDLKNCAFLTEIDAKKLRKGFAKSGDILLSHKATIGRTALVQESEFDYIVLTPQITYYRILISDKLENRYLKYYFDSSVFQKLLAAWAGAGSTRAYIGITAQRKLPITLPPIQIQKAISSILNSLDDRIENLRETNTTLESIAQTLFKSWFIDFDPVRAKSEGREPEGVDAETAAFFPDSFEESALGLIPKGWNIKHLHEVSEILNGCAFKSGDYASEENGCFVLRTKNFNSNGYAERLSDDVFLPNSFLKTHQQYCCESFDFHLVMVGASIGKTSVLLPHMLPALRNQNMWCFRQKSDFPSKFFIHEIVKEKVSIALQWSSGSAREFFRKGDFEKNQFICPTDEILTIFESVISRLKAKIAVNENMSILLSTLRDSLLPRLISGQLALSKDEIKI